MRKVLIVDDAKSNRVILKTILSKDYDLIEAEDGKEALTIMHRNYRLLSAIVLDLMMPVMDGYEVLSAMRDNVSLAQIPVIVVTASADDDSRVKALALGANDFVTKPFHPDIIRHCLRNNISLRETASIMNAIQKDKLTGVFTREAFFSKVSELVRDHGSGTFVLTCFDIDNFKLINDQYGAVVGDKILRGIGTNIKTIFEELDGVCGRISGDNFAGIYPNTPEAEEFIEKNRDRAMLSAARDINMSYSVGRYVINDVTLSASSMYDRAYIAKQSVKGLYDRHLAYFDEDMLNNLVQEQQITNEMDAALKKKQFEVWFQPQVNSANGAIIGAEALVRWRHPVRGLISPGIFIPIFERNGFIYELDKEVWEQTCQYIRKWIDEGLDPVPVSVNISRCDIFREDLILVIEGLVERYGITKNLLRLEITESAFETATDHIVTVVKQLIERGFTIEIDDFGSGYSSLNTLKDVPAHVLKLDMKFLNNSGHDDRGGNIVESVVRMAKWIGMSVLAEGVETQEQADFLKSVGCNYIQGYLYARPMPEAGYLEYVELLQKETSMQTLETIEHLNNRSFWDPKSIDTLIFNSYVGAACVVEYKNGHLELLRTNKKFSLEVGSMDVVSELTHLNQPIRKLSESYHKVLLSCITKAIETSKEETCEVSLKKLNDKEEVRFLVAARTIANTNDRWLLYCTVSNITAQYRINEALTETNGMLTLLADSIPGGIATYEYKNGDISIVYYNDGFCKTLGYTKKEYDELSKKSVSSCIFKEDFHIIEEQLVNLLGGTKTIECVYRIQTKQGECRWLMHRAQIISRRKDAIHINSVFLDVTDEYTKETNLSTGDTSKKCDSTGGEA